MSFDKAQVDYLRWVSAEHPDLFKAVAAKTYLGQESNDPKDKSLRWITAVIQAVATIGSAVLQKKQQDKAFAVQKKQALAEQAAEADLRQQLLITNTKRAQAGMGPVDINGIPIPSSQLPMPQSLAAYAAGAGASMLPLILLGAGALVIVLALKR
jgi:hypothetical protein